MVGITQSLAVELAPFGIIINAYCPGVINTEMWKYNDREWGRLLGGYGPGDYFNEAVGRIPLGRPGSPEEVAGLVTFLASDDASYITGQAIHVNGGSIMGHLRLSELLDGRELMGVIGSVPEGTAVLLPGEAELTPLSTNLHF